jgi:SHS family lactate transporter-like MFS transporter
MADIQEKPQQSNGEATSSPEIQEHMSVMQYVMTRIPTLVPPMRPAPNPFKALALLNRQQWLFFSVWAWLTIRTIQSTNAL